MADPRNVLITGGYRGIGLSIAHAFVQAGDNVVVVDRAGEPPAGMLGVSCDVTDTASVDAAFTSVLSGRAANGATAVDISLCARPETFDASVAFGTTSVLAMTRPRSL